MNHTSDAEIYTLPDEKEGLCRIISCTPQKKNSKELSDNLIKSFGSLSAVLEASEDMHIKCGVSSATSAFLRMIPSMCRYYKSACCIKEGDILRAKAIQQYITYRFAGLLKETVMMILLDKKNKILYSAKISEGGISGVSLVISDIVTLAVSKNAEKAIIAHNHPSGLALPSKEDLAVTKDLNTALKLVNIELYDHIITADEECFSFRDQGFL